MTSGPSGFPKRMDRSRRGPTVVADVLVIGGGLAGWRAAQAAVAHGATVCLVANGEGNSPHVHALNCPVLPEDSVACHRADTLSSGHGANDPELVQTLCEGAARLKDEFAFDREADGSYRLLKSLGSTVPRCVMIGPAIGAEILRRIRAELSGRVSVVEATVQTLAPGWTASCQTPGPSFELQARAVVLATGGWCGKYGFSTNPPYLKGDGLRMAEAMGAEIVDRDLVQYEPTAALEPAALRGIPVITTMLFEGATFRNASGETFLPDCRLNKDELSQAILRELARGGGVRGGVWYDATRVPRALLETRYAPLVRRYAEAGVDIARDWMLVAPAPHTSLGGVRIDSSCRVLDKAGHPIPGLFAAGEVTGGVHGANRLGGNAGTEVLVFGKIAGRAAAEFTEGGKRK